MAYEWIHRFNTSGFTTSEQAPNPRARPPTITGPQVRELIDIALSTPGERGLPFSVWTVPKLAAYCCQRGLLAPITDEWVRRLLRREGLRAQRIRTWKTSDDPAFDRKETHPAALPDVPAAGGGDLLRRVPQWAVRRRKRVADLSEAFRRLRACYPRRRWFVING